MANVGFHDVDEKQKALAVSKGTLFIHGSANSGGSIYNSMNKTANSAMRTSAVDCTRSCAAGQLAVGILSFCDESCSAEWSPSPLLPTGPRFGGQGCGAGDASTYGTSCRLCYENQQVALQADRDLEATRLTSVSAAEHVVMCDTQAPPAALNCSADFADAETDPSICDYRCGGGKYGNFHCNWRGLGDKCRLCFDDPVTAYLADGIARAHDSRVVMCATHEPPTFGANFFESFVLRNSSADEDQEPLLLDIDRERDQAQTVHSGTVLRGEMCGFLRGYFEFLAETEVAVSSILQFMPGMRVGIATYPRDYHVFNRTVGHLPGVSIANSSMAEHAALHADKICGEGTRLIYYMSPGVILSREFTSKDTHTPRGDLVVAFHDVQLVDPETAKRARGSAAVLGFASPSFTYGGDLILPAAINGQLRTLLRQDRQLASRPKRPASANGFFPEGRPTATREITAQRCFANFPRVFVLLTVCQVLAALAYALNPDGVVFTSPVEWSKKNLFATKSIWDIPLVKPAFSCSYNVAWATKGYDLANHLAGELEAFARGAKCELGFKATNPGDLRIKRHWEFGVQGALEPMPDLRDYNISVMYRTFVGDADLFNLSLTTVLERFSSALEIVVVVLEAEVELFEGIVNPFRASAKFPLRIIGEPDLMDGHVQQKYSKLRGDLYTQGDYILHLDSDVVLFEDLTYDHMFHLGKPVLPYRRYRIEDSQGMLTSMCWQRGTSFAVEEEVVREFSVFNTHVYPREMYSAARNFIEEHHGLPFGDFMSTRRGFCPGTEIVSKWTLAERDLLFSDFNYMGAFLWYHMRDAVYWLAADPYDAQLYDWRPDLIKYAWVCQASGRHTPHDAAGLAQYVADFRMVTSVNQCRLVNQLWKEARMKDPNTRVRVDTNSEEWNE
ncbi:unnamed protein product [Hapterophycus canaliculatus]